MAPVPRTRTGALAFWQLLPHDSLTRLALLADGFLLGFPVPRFAFGGGRPGSSHAGCHLNNSTVGSGAGYRMIIHQGNGISSIVQCSGGLADSVHLFILELYVIVSLFGVACVLVHSSVPRESWASSDARGFV